VERKKTNKPCPGCKKGPKYKSNTGYRFEDEVCEECKKILWEAQCQKNRLSLGETEGKLYGVTYDKYRVIPFIDCPISSDVKLEISKSLVDLITLVSKPVENEFDGWEKVEKLFDFDKERREYSYKHERRNDSSFLYTPVREFAIDVSKPIRDLIKNIHGGLEFYYKEGFRRGSDLLGGLASGEKTVEEFENERIK